MLPNDAAALIIQAMKDAVSLPVLMPRIPGQRWSCHSCAYCCRELFVHLFDDDCERIDRQGWADRLRAAPYVKAGRHKGLNKREDGACVFLDEHNRCKIHTEYGEDAKPLACRLFPFSVRPNKHGWQASLRFDCPSVVRSEGQPVSQHRSWLVNVAKRLNHTLPPDGEEPLLQRGMRAASEEVDAVVTRFRRWLRSEDLPVTSRLIGAARVTTTLAGASYAKVRGSRFAELLDLLFGALQSECGSEPDRPSGRQRAMLLQLAFAHAEHMTLRDMRAGVLHRLRRRWSQVRCAKRFRVGKGQVPPLPGLGGLTTFEAVDAVGRPATELDEIDELLIRYTVARLEGRSAFGLGYYGWPLFSGLGALWLSIVAIGWLARYGAALDGADSVALRHVGQAIGIVDRAATRLPALGTVAERMRSTYLLNDDGVARLLNRYSTASIEVGP